MARHLVRLLLLTAVLILLIAPLSQAFDRHDHYSPRDVETNLCVLVVVASAGFWAFRTVYPPQLRRRLSRSLEAPRLAITRTLGSVVAPSPPPSPPAPLRV
ncbi:MAG: hypothetical protein EPN33_09790 [Acidobacteria bacterium]|nr:MAG: hypothetical protein EPN33_09790 [Acidobacteriota bacterium]